MKRYPIYGMILMMILIPNFLTSLGKVEPTGPEEYSIFTEQYNNTDKKISIFKTLSIQKTESNIGTINLQPYIYLDNRTKNVKFEARILFFPAEGVTNFSNIKLKSLVFSVNEHRIQVPIISDPTQTNQQFNLIIMTGLSYFFKNSIDDIAASILKKDPNMGGGWHARTNYNFSMANTPLELEISRFFQVNPQIYQEVIDMRERHRAEHEVSAFNDIANVELLYDTLDGTAPRPRIIFRLDGNDINLLNTILIYYKVF